MNANLTTDQIKEVKTKFQVYLELLDEQDTIREGLKNVKKDVAEIVEGTSSEAGKLLKLMHRLWNGEGNDLDEISAVVYCIQNNSGDSETEETEEKEEEED